MNIQEAAKKAVEMDKNITRSKSFWAGVTKVKPTDTSENCIVSVAESYCKEHDLKIPAPRRGWQPKAEDLVADDWLVVD